MSRRRASGTRAMNSKARAWLVRKLQSLIDTIVGEYWKTFASFGEPTYDSLGNRKIVAGRRLPAVGARLPRSKGLSCRPPHPPDPAVDVEANMRLDDDGAPAGPAAVAGGPPSHDARRPRRQCGRCRELFAGDPLLA